MRYIVKYRKPDQIEGARVFDMDGRPTEEALARAAQETAGVGAEVVEVYENDQSRLGEWESK